MIPFLAGTATGAAAAALALGLLFSRRRRRLGRFLSFAAHEINTPITAINMTVLNFITGVFGELPEDQKPWFEILRDQIIRLGAMAGEWRDLIHWEIIQDLSIEVAAVDAEDKIRRAIEAVAHGLRQSGAEIVTDIEPGLPRIQADDDRFFRTMVTLLHHARKFKAPGNVSLRARHADGRVKIEILYPCLPIQPQEARRSLALLYPADAAGGAAVATGLGLGIVRAVARLQGGELTLRVDEGPTTTIGLEMLDWAGGRMP